MMSNQQLASLKIMHTILLTYFLLMFKSVPSIAVSVSPHRPFPKGFPTERAGEMLVKLRMNGAQPTLDGELICHGFTLEKGDEFWVKQFKAVGNEDAPHHIGIYACDHVPAGDPCTCPLEKRTLVYSSVRHTPPYRLPPNVGFHVGGISESQFLFLEVHYCKPAQQSIDGDYETGVDLYITRDKQKFVAGYYSPMAIGTIPPRQTDFTLEGCFKVDRKVSFNVFAYQPHGHSLPQLVSGYRISKRSGEMVELGRGNPLLPQAHYAEPRIIDVEPEDTIIVRCLMDSSNQKDSINTIWMPVTSNNPQEMCILHLIYYADSSINTKDHYKTGQCTEKQIASLPKNSKERLPANALLEDHALNGNLKAGTIRINQNITMNMELEDFESLFGPYSKKEKTVFIEKKKNQ